MKHFFSMLAVNCCVGIVPALAHEAPASWVPVGDEVLAHATGKYLDHDMISGFQLAMISQWQTPSGANLYAAGAINVQPTGKGLSVSSSTHTGITPSLNNQTGQGLQVPTGGNLLQINGVGQITQVAGNGNSVANQTVIDFQSQGGAPGNGASSAGSSSSQNGMSATVSIDANGMNVALQSSFGSVEQSIVSGAGSPINRIMQTVQIAGNQQQALNTLELHLQTNPITANVLRQIGTQQAIISTLGIRR